MKSISYPIMNKVPNYYSGACLIGLIVLTHHHNWFTINPWTGDFYFDYTTYHCGAPVTISHVLTDDGVDYKNGKLNWIPLYLTLPVFAWSDAGYSASGKYLPSNEFFDNHPTGVYVRPKYFNIIDKLKQVNSKYDTTLLYTHPKGLPNLEDPKYWNSKSIIGPRYYITKCTQLAWERGIKSGDSWAGAVADDCRNFQPSDFTFDNVIYRSQLVNDRLTIIKNNDGTISTKCFCPTVGDLAVKAMDVTLIFININIKLYEKDHPGLVIKYYLITKENHPQNNISFSPYRREVC